MYRSKALSLFLSTVTQSYLDLIFPLFLTLATVSDTTDFFLGYSDIILPISHLEKIVQNAHNTMSRVSGRLGVTSKMPTLYM